MLIDHNHKPSAFGPGHCRPCANHSNLSATAPPIRRLKHLAWHHAAIFVTRPTGQPRTVFEQAVASVPHVYTPNRSFLCPRLPAMRHRRRSARLPTALRRPPGHPGRAAPQRHPGHEERCGKPSPPTLMQKPGPADARQTSCTGAKASRVRRFNVSHGDRGFRDAFPLKPELHAEPSVGRELRGATRGGAAASVPQPVGAVGVVHPGGQATVCVVGGRRSAAAIRRTPA